MGHAQPGRDLADGQPLRPQLAGPLDPLLPPTLSRRDRPGQPAKHSGQRNQLPRRRAADHGRGLRVKTVADLIGRVPGHVLGQPQRRRHLAAAPGGGLRGGLGHVCILAPREPASTGATGRDGRGRGNRLGAAVAARSGPAQRRARPGRAGAGRRVAMPPLGRVLGRAS